MRTGKQRRMRRSAALSVRRGLEPTAAWLSMRGASASSIFYGLARGKVVSLLRSRVPTTLPGLAFVHFSQLVSTFCESFADCEHVMYM